MARRFLAIEDSDRESTESWRSVVRDLKTRGMKVTPKLLVSDGTVEFCAAPEEQFPQTRDQRCGGWFVSSE